MMRLLLILIFVFSCKTQPIRQEIEVGKTIKVEPSSFTLRNEEFNFLWSSPNGPENTTPSFKIENDKMLFTPDVIGKYEISLMIESLSSNTIYEETFLYNAIASSNSSISYTTTTKNKNDSINAHKNKYTIQVASWPTLEQARNDQISLREQGYDAYTEQYYIKTKDQLWWRVRVGNFSDKSIAIKVKNKLSTERGSDLWIDFIN